MIDYFKALINIQNEARLRQLASEGVFSTRIDDVDPETHELIKEAYIYENLYIRSTNKGLLIRGSLHKYRSRIKGIATRKQIEKYQGFNGDLFTLSDINETLQTLCEVIGFAPSLAVLQNIEIGVNCEVSFDPKDFLKGMLFHRSNFEYKTDHEGNYIQFNYQTYFLKIYNKGKQYDLPNNVLRVEIKVMKMIKLKEVGVNLETLNDINAVTLLKAFEVLYNEFEAVTYYDHTLRLEDLTSKQQGKVIEYQNKNYWQDLDKQQKKYNKKQLETMIQEFSNNLKGQIKGQMIEAKNNILQMEKGAKFTPFNHLSQTQNLHLLTTPTEKAKFTPSNSLSKGIESVNSTFENTPLESVKKDTDLDTKKTAFEVTNLDTEKDKKTEVKKTALEGLKVEMRFCPITGVSLELEDDKRNYITTKTLKHLKETDPDRYALICSMNLPHTGKHTKYETDIDAHIAKQIRNYYRYRHNVKGKEWAKQLTFDFDTPAVVNE
jgi:hypothetical protein|nr:MAG TPA: hypothetical protein [Bacteriophage sp.]